MRRKISSFMALSIVLLSGLYVCGSCSELEHDDVVDYWKAQLSWKYTREQCNKDIKSYLDRRLGELTASPGEIEQAYCALAKGFFTNSGYFSGFSGDYNVDRLRDYVNGIDNQQLMSLDGIDAGASAGILANLKSHPETYVDNIQKIVGDFEEMRAWVGRGVEAEKVEGEQVAGYDTYHVLYNINNEHYAVCSILKRNDEHSEITFNCDDKMLGNVLDCWSLYEKDKDYGRR